MADEKKEVQPEVFILPDQTIFRAGVLNGILYTEDEVRSYAERLKELEEQGETKPLALFLDHEDKVATWIGETKNYRLEDSEVKADLIIVDRDVAEKIKYQQESGRPHWGISTVVEVQEWRDFKKLEPKSVSLVLNPAGGERLMIKGEIRKMWEEEAQEGDLDLSEESIEKLSEELEKYSDEIEVFLPLQPLSFSLEESFKIASTPPRLVLRDKERAISFPISDLTVKDETLFIKLKDAPEELLTLFEERKYEDYVFTFFKKNNRAEEKPAPLRSVEVSFSSLGSSLRGAEAAFPEKPFFTLNSGGEKVEKTEELEEQMEEHEEQEEQKEAESNEAKEKEHAIVCPKCGQLISRYPYPYPYRYPYPYPKKRRKKTEEEEQLEREIERMQKELEELRRQKLEQENEFFVQSLKREGKYLPVFDETVPQLLNLQTSRLETIRSFSEGSFDSVLDSIQKKENEVRTNVKKLLTSLPKLVQFGEVSPSPKNEAEALTEDERLHRQAEKLSAEKGISYKDAVIELAKERR
jgi:hypothetical protein